jgi:hypothetical protein
MTRATGAAEHRRCWRVSLQLRLTLLVIAVAPAVGLAIGDHQNAGWMWPPIAALALLGIPFYLACLPSVCLTEDRVIVRTLFRRKSFARSDVVHAFAGQFGLSVVTRDGGAMAWGIWRTQVLTTVTWGWEYRADRIAAEIRAWAGLPPLPPRGKPTPIRRLLRGREKQ